MAASDSTTTNNARKGNNKDAGDKIRIIKTPVDLQRLKLEKLMNNPNKEIVIPEKSKEKNPRAPLEFIRNIWGSSAGAGSGDFHVYRGVRRREYARQKFINEKAKKDELDDAYKTKVEANKIEADERTAKKRAKRLKKKEKLKAKKLKMKSKPSGGDKKSDSEDEEESNEESDDEKEANSSQQ